MAPDRPSRPNLPPLPTHPQDTSSVPRFSPLLCFPFPSLSLIHLHSPEEALRKSRDGSAARTGLG